MPLGTAGHVGPPVSLPASVAPPLPLPPVPASLPPPPPPPPPAPPSFLPPTEPQPTPNARKDNGASKDIVFMEAARYPAGSATTSGRPGGAPSDPQWQRAAAPWR